MNNPKYAEYIKIRGEVSPFFAGVFKAMQRGGELDEISDEEALEKVADMAEQLKLNQWKEC